MSKARAATTRSRSAATVRSTSPQRNHRDHLPLDAKKRGGAMSLPRRGQGRGRWHRDGETSPAPEDFAAQAPIRAGGSIPLDANPRPAHGEAARARTRLHPLNRELFADLVPGTGKLALSVTPSAALDVASAAASARPRSARLHRADREPCAASALCQRALGQFPASRPSTPGSTSASADAIETVLARQGSEGALRALVGWRRGPVA